MEYILDVDLTDEKELLRLVHNHIKTQGAELDYKDFEEKFYDREERGSTYMGNNIALPHIESIKLHKTGIVLVRLNNYLTWTGGENVKFLFFVLIRDLVKDQDKISKIQKIVINLDDDILLNSLREGEECDIEKNIRRIV